MLTERRDHETRHLRAPHNLSHQCRPQLSLRLYLQTRLRTHRNRHIVLALILLTPGVRSLHFWMGPLGRMVETMSAKLGTFSRLAILGVVHAGTEWWAFEIVALAAGRLGMIPLAAQSVIMTSDQVMNTIPFGVGVAASSRVGNLLGAKNARGAARAANTAAWLSMMLELSFSPY
jgi:Na+-driven multidrug efflux pump